jgi:DNA polymerase III delta prime subunit
MRITGHQNHIELLHKLHQKKRLHSTMLFYGRAGIGKELVARKLAQSIFCSEQQKSEEPLFSCGQCKKCLLFAAGTLPDFYSIDFSNKEENTTEYIRDFLAKLGLKSFLGGAKIAIFNACESLSTQGSNLLLKTLEEPSFDTYFILIAANHTKLLKTITSRCFTLFFEDLRFQDIVHEFQNHPEAFTASLTEEELSQESIRSLNDFPVASFSEAYMILKNAEQLSEIFQKLEHIYKGSLKTAIDLAKEVTKEKESIRETLALITFAASSKLKRRPRKQLTTDEQLRYTMYLFRWSNFLLKLIQAEMLVFERNLNPHYLLQSIFIEFAQGSLCSDLAALEIQGTFLNEQIFG